MAWMFCGGEAELLLKLLRREPFVRIVGRFRVLLIAS